MLKWILVNKVVNYLNEQIVGNVYDKASILDAYSTDRSILKITPRFVAVPETTADVQELLKFSYELSRRNFSLPITVRGSGLDKTGADLGSGLIISTEKLNQVQEIDERSRLVRVQAGTTLGDLNQVLAIYGLMVPVQLDPRETIGGLIANFPTDPVAKKYGSIFYFVDRVEVALANGDLIQTTSYTARGLARMKKQTNFEGKIYRDLEKLLNEKFDLIDDLSEDDPKSTGYQMVARVQGKAHKTFDLLPVFFASQGTLGVITEVILRCEPIPRPSAHVLASFMKIDKALEFLKKVEDLDPVHMDIYDVRIFRAAAEHGKNLSIISKRMKSGYYVLISFDDFSLATRAKLKKCMEAAKPLAASVLVENEENSADFIELDSVVNAYLNDGVDGERVALMDNVRVPAENLPDFLSDLKKLEKKFERDLPIYGSYGTSSYSVRPKFQLDTLEDRQKVMNFLKTYSDLVVKHDGEVAGSGSEGRTKAIVTTPKLRREEKALYEAVKKIFDPQNILNPEVKLGIDLKNTVRHLRTSNNPGVVTE